MSAPSHQPGSCRHPGVYVIDPGKYAEGCVYQVELAMEFVGRIAGVGLYEGHMHAALLGEGCRLRQRRRGEVEAGHTSPRASEEDRVEANVALDVADIQPADVPDGSVERSLLLCVK
ncbi:MAG: hypothetical protein M0T79_00705 [Actinomycetota bacterium]|nr:hypothetical protein [Actinomycetota bacterium]MDA8355481.1 hypothetical protein [Actinomycetota bacterium]